MYNVTHFGWIVEVHVTADLNVTPVPKSGDRQEVNNYRPVSVLPVLAKILEGIVHDQLFG